MLKNSGATAIVSDTEGHEGLDIEVHDSRHASKIINKREFD
ncbi:hypothetical protein ACEQPO_04910 [Bacillus sp. SL00103]